MTKNYIKKAIENGTVEFISVSEQTQYTIIKGSFGWRADGINIHSGTDNGFYFEETLNLLASRLSEIDDLEIADDNVIGLKRKVMSGCGSLHIVAMFDPITGELLETYISKGSTGGCQSNLAAVSRLISLSARAGVDVYTIADQLKSCPACPSYVGRTMTKHDTSKGKCCPDAIANALINMYKEMKNSIFSDDIEMSNVKSKVIKKNTEDKEQSVNVKNPCPVCGEELTFEGGCNVCKACGWSKCD